MRMSPDGFRGGTNSPGRVDLATKLCKIELLINSLFAGLGIQTFSGCRGVRLPGVPWDRGEPTRGTAYESP